MMEDQLERSFSFTPLAEREILNTVEDLSFPDQEAEMIFQSLQRRLRHVPFSDYLKRYVYLTTGMTGSFRAIPLEEYQGTIMDAFRDTGTPSSMHHGNSHLATRVRNWLQQDSIQRNAMLLLGFGLSMPLEDVNRFLTHACHDHALDPAEPMDAVCAYCYTHQYGYAKMEQLMEVYRQTEPGGDGLALLREAQPAHRPESRNIIREDMELIRRLAARKDRDAPTPQQRKTREAFRALHLQAQNVVCSAYPDEFAAPMDVVPTAFEKILCAPIPRTRHGNLVSHLSSNLQKEISSHRFTRQHLHQLLTGGMEPNRYDLILLSFLIHAEESDSLADPRSRYRSFLNRTNDILKNCGFGPLYAADPWECLILMCMLAEDPLDAYASVNEMTYAARPGEEDPHE